MQSLTQGIHLLLEQGNLTTLLIDLIIQLQDDLLGLLTVELIRM